MASIKTAYYTEKYGVIYSNIDVYIVLTVSSLSIIFMPICGSLQ